MNNIQRLAYTFALSSVMPVLTACDNGHSNNPYADQPTHHADDITPTFLHAGDYAENLIDGVHIISFTDNDEAMLVIRDRDRPSGYTAYGYFGTIAIGNEYIPQRPSDFGNRKLSFWTISEGDIAENLADGIHKLVIPGHLLNGTDLELSVIKDAHRASGYTAYGYFGITQARPSEPAPSPEG